MQAEYETMASPYARIAEILDFVEETFLLNIGVAGRRDVGQMTLDDLRAILASKIDHYSKYVATTQSEVFREQDPLEKWIKDGVIAKTTM